MRKRVNEFWYEGLKAQLDKELERQEAQVLHVIYFFFGMWTQIIFHSLWTAWKSGHWTVLIIIEEWKQRKDVPENYGYEKSFYFWSVACGIYFPDQGSNLDPLHWESRVLATGPPGKSQKRFLSDFQKKC